MERTTSKETTAAQSNTGKTPAGGLNAGAPEGPGVSTSPLPKRRPALLLTSSCSHHPQMAWSTLDTSTLHAYRHAYRLDTPSAFSSSLNQMILQNSASGVGRRSPTMARAKDRRRVGRDRLALAVRMMALMRMVVATALY